MIQSYAALATLLATLDSTQGNPNHPLLGGGQLKKALEEILPGAVCMARGSITGTGAAIKVGRDVGVATADDTNNVVDDDFLKFSPELVIVLNKTDGSLFVHLRGMANASFFSVILAGAYVSVQGITMRTNGFTIGTDATINTANDELFYIAFGR
jgi:hypothetical protein